MKNILYLFIILGLISVATATTVRVPLDIGESYVLNGKNITLVNSNNNAVIVCVNGEKKIIDEERTVNGAIIERIDSNKKSASLRINVDCEDKPCLCGPECSNLFCLPPKPIETKTETETETEAILPETETQGTEKVKEVAKEQEIIEEVGQEEMREEIKKESFDFSNLDFLKNTRQIALYLGIVVIILFILSRKRQHNLYKNKNHKSKNK